jgi:hypothetical protein
MTKLLKKYKHHYLYAKTFGDTDIQVAYFSKITDLFAKELYSEFGFDTCCEDEKVTILNETFKLLQND